MNLENLILMNFAYKASYIARQMEDMFVKENELATIVNSELPSDTFNVILVSRREAIVEEGISQELEYFRNKQYPFSIWYWNHDDFDGNESNEGIGLVHTETNVAMVKDITAPANHPELPQGFEIHPVETSSDIHAFGTLVSSFFGETREGAAVKHYYERIAASSNIMGNADLKLFIGEERGRPVSTGSLIVAPDSIGIYDMGTSDNDRGKGYGSLMFQYLLAEARKYNKKWCVLLASPEGYSIYEKTGFKAVGEMNVLENRGSR